ncbi:PTS sugar transporter subunit IIA [Amycolatopsis sp. NBC_00345]|uniref:PTS sugar transporter subunit IIA n=1 Tax=Amycolatopsis sp. NBC_00345 TaxID=2975955 RepID=UPI003FA4512B
MGPLPAETSLLDAAGVRLGQTAASRSDAVVQVGRALLDIGAVEAGYLPAMHVRERSVSTFIGEGVAIPHGTGEARKYVRRTSLVVLQFPEGVDWGGHDVRMCVGIAASGNEQVGILSSLARVLLDAGRAAQLREAKDTETVIRILQSTGEESDQ